MTPTEHLPEQLLKCPVVEVASEWIDYNGHMNMAYYNVAFDQYGTDYLLDQLGLGLDYVRRTNASMFTLEQHVTYLHELKLGDSILIACQLLDYDNKRLHCFLNMYHADAGFLAATSEQLLMHVNLEIRRSSALPDAAIGKLAAMMLRHQELANPPQASHVIGIQRK